MAAQIADYNREADGGAIAAAPYQSFGSLRFRASLDATQLAHTALAAAWADAIVLYWRCGIASGSINPAHPLYLIDLAAHDAQLSWLLGNALQQRLQAEELDLSLCYLALCDDAEDAVRLGTHPYFEQAIKAGQLDFAYWNKERDALHLEHQKRSLRHCVNPLVILALAYFQTLPSELFGIYYGQLVHGQVAPGAPSEAGCALEYRWQDWAEDCVEDAAEGEAGIAAPLLAHYRQRCHGNALQLPLTACNVLDTLQHWCAGRSLMLALDHGVSSEQQIRLGALHPPSSWQADTLAPAVNFHAIKLHQERNSAAVWQQQLDDSGMVLHLSWSNAGHLPALPEWEALCSNLAKTHPDDLQRMATAKHDPSELLAYLRLTHYEPQLLKTNMDAWLAQPPTLSDTARRNWQAALLRCWQHYLPAASL